jgi:hypothetical protein
MLGKLLKRIKPGEAIASMGYPDIAVPREQMESLLNGREVPFREDSADIAKRHGLPAGTLVPDSEAFFELYGCALDVYDVVQERGCELVCDLNYPLPARVCGQYDYVLDVGTLEHCFNIAQAAVNMACLLKVGGTIFHENPFNCGNHGFYGLNPTWYHDFYTDNGFELESVRLISRDGRAAEIPPTKRFIAPEQEFNCFAVAKRLEEREITFPTQSKYRRP